MTEIKKIFAGAMIVVSAVVIMPVAAFAKGAPDSFADLAEKLLPAVVNVNTTQTIKINRRSMPRIPGMDRRLILGRARITVRMRTAKNAP